MNAHRLVAHPRSAATRARVAQQSCCSSRARGPIRRLLAKRDDVSNCLAFLAFLRFTRGEIGAAAALAVSIALWIVPALLAARRLGRVEL